MADDAVRGGERHVPAAPTPRRTTASVLTLAGLFVLGALVAWWATPNSAIPGNDSWFYVGVARNLGGGASGSGAGLSSPFAHELSGLSPTDAAAGIGHQPITAWPPLYPIVLASGSLVSISVESMARLVNVVALGAVASLTGLLVLRLRGSWAAAGLAGALCVSGLATVFGFALAATEPLYLALQLGALVLAATLGRLVSPGRLAGFVVLAAGAALTRYVGLAVVATGVVMVATTSTPLTRWRRLAWSAGAATAAVPVLLWWAAARRAPGFRGGTAFENRLGDLHQSLRAAGEWFVPTDVLSGWRVPVAMVIGVAVAAATTYAFARSSSGEAGDAPPTATAGSGDRRLAATLVVHLVLFEVVLLASASFLDHAIPLGTRLVMPLAPSVLALVFAAGDRLVRLPRSSRARVALGGAAVVVALALVVVQARDTYDRFLSRSPGGLWSQLDVPPAVASLQDLPADALVFTNQPSALYAFTGRPVLALPLQRSPMTGEPNPAFADELAALVDLVEDDSAVVVIDRSSAFFTEGVITSEADLAAVADLEVAAEDPTFVVLRAGPGQGAAAGS